MDAADLRRACAVLGLSIPVNEDRLKRRYKALVRRWHPDRYQADPAGQAEATRRLCDINIAYDMLSRTLGTREAAEEVPTPPPPAAPSYTWSKERVDAIVDSMNESNRLELFPDWNFHRIISGLVALVWLGPAAHAGGLLGFLMFVLMLLAVACIWFPEAFGVWTLGPLRIIVQKTSPGFVVRLAGWVLFLSCIALMGILRGLTH